MNLFLLAVIIRQLAIICIALMCYCIYRLWNPNVTPLHLKPLTISISITILIVIIISLSVKWFTSPIDYLPDDIILYILHSKAELVIGEMLIAFTILCYGISLINFKSVFNSKIETKKLGLFTLFFISIVGTIGFTAYEQQVQLSPQQEQGLLKDLPISQPNFNDQFFTDTVTEHTETVLYTNNQDVTISERIHDVSDLFIATVPSGGGLPIAPNTTRIDTIHLRKQNINGQTITQSDKLIMTEEYLNEM